MNSLITQIGSNMESTRLLWNSSRRQEYNTIILDTSVTACRWRSESRDLEGPRNAWDFPSFLSAALLVVGFFAAVAGGTPAPRRVLQRVRRATSSPRAQSAVQQRRHLRRSEWTRKTK